MAHNVIAEAKRCLNCKKPLCRQGCPINTPIPDFISAFLSGDIKRAGKMLFDNNPLSVVCSIVCNHGNQCQGHCVRGLKGGYTCTTACTFWSDPSPLRSAGE